MSDHLNGVAAREGCPCHIVSLHTVLICAYSPYGISVLQFGMHYI